LSLFIQTPKLRKSIPILENIDGIDRTNLFVLYR
jgi:hypothetical protein